MFLKKVYRHNKLMFAGMLFFIGMQLLVGYKHGMVFSPWFNYGMYSGRIAVSDTYEINIVQPYTTSYFAPEKWDHIHYTLSQYQAIDRNDSLFKNEVSRLFPKIFLARPNAAHFMSVPGNQSFDEWYKNHLYNLPAVGKSQPAVQRYTYKWNGEQLTRQTHE